MGDVDQDVAVLKDWREDHAKEHDGISKKFEDQAAMNITFIRAIEQLQTKLTIYVGVAVVLGSVIGQVVTKYINIGVR